MRDARPDVAPGTPFQLEAARRQSIFERDIAPAYLACRSNPAGPLAVVLVVQGGSGKTALAHEIADALAPHRGVVQIDTDLYRPFHPHSAELSGVTNALHQH